MGFSASCAKVFIASSNFIGVTSVVNVALSALQEDVIFFAVFEFKELVNRLEYRGKNPASFGDWLEYPAFTASSIRVIA